MNLPANFNEMVAAMLRCEQTQGQTVYQHGQSVREHLFDLIEYLKGEVPHFQWRLPDWIFEFKTMLLENLHDADVMTQYTLYHDCGKPFCRKVDEDGRAHFPDHARVSAEVWAAVGGDERVGVLIAEDMLLHTASAEQVGHKCQEINSKDMVTLLLAALAEIHSNAKLFGGLDSISFKQKFKQLDRRGRQICRHLVAR